MKTGAFIDSHAHLAMNYDSKELEKAVEHPTLKQVWLLALECYTDRGFAGNKKVLEVAKRYPGFFVPFGFIDFNGTAEQIDRMKDAGFVGLKALRSPENYDCQKYFPIYERAETLKMPILFHVGIISKSPQCGLTAKNYCTGPTKMRPSMLDGISAAFPDLKLIHGHMGIPWANELFESLFYYPNIYASISGLIDYKWLIENLDRRAEDGRSFTKKLMFSVDRSYGLKGTLQKIIDRAEFTWMFFENVGRTYHWGQNATSYMYNNAKKFIEPFIL